MARVTILDKDSASGVWVQKHLYEIGIDAYCAASVTDLMIASGEVAPPVCLIAIRPPVNRVLSLITELTQEPRFSATSFILMGSSQYKRAAFEAGADDYLIMPLDVIELRKRVRLYLDHHEYEARLVAETSMTQEISSLGGGDSPAEETSLTLLEHTAALTLERNRLDTVLRAAGQPVGLVAPDGTLLYANLAWEQLYGRASAVIGTAIDWPPVTSDPAASESIRAALARQDAWEGDVQYVLPDGRQLDMGINISPAVDAAGDLVGYVVIQHDIAERRTLERLKTQFLADAATEMQGPVTNIKMRQYLLRESPSDQHKIHLQALERETERLSYLVELMLELSRLDADLVRMDLELTDLNQLLGDVMVRFGSTAADKGIQLRSEADPSLPKVPADPAQLVRVLCLMLDNALRYTPRGGLVDVRLGREAWTGGEFATLQIQDSGIGIEAEALPHVFERFYRGARARNSGIRGVGLGLAIAYEIINRHRGDITVESQIDHGSIFTIWLPMR